MKNDESYIQIQWKYGVARPPTAFVPSAFPGLSDAELRVLEARYRLDLEVLKIAEDD